MLVITDSNMSTSLHSQTIPRPERHIPYTFSVKLQPLAVHVLANQHNATLDPIPAEFARGRGLTVAMVQGTTERLRRESRETPGWHNPKVAPNTQAQWGWRVLCPPKTVTQSGSPPAEDRNEDEESRELDCDYTAGEGEANMTNALTHMVDSSCHK
ncbi:hypothetical protein AK830_g5669 [Neonectria ditissima]|uniref:Uncharacterized protein n=1 Tax=Neonectria ditissima TaxID=78410 RepID=A0A0P7B3E2_9HYPO|nr:hypothetical protein AK830_g5669 [Neonectria ditissima]